MDTLKAIEKLAQETQGEKVPAFDVADNVLRQIRAGEEETLGFFVFDLFASVSAVAASVVGYISVGALKSMTNPLMEFVAPLQEVRLW
ncbi:MAG: hypothetical protein ACYSW0_21560 [Planctomycetota bacterium]|jgi:ubiquitin